MTSEMKAILVRAVRRLLTLGVLAAIIYYGCLPLSNWFLNGQHPLLEGLRQHVAKNLPEYLTFIGALAIAFVCTWPAMIPGTAQDWWTWCRDAFQTAVPAARPRGDSHGQSPLPPPPSQPDGPAQPTS